MDEERRFAVEREAMVRTQIAARGISDERVLAALRTVPRHRFVPEPCRSAAYADQPLPIGEGQTISQPYIVALMTQALSLRGNERVLEVGTGSGYQAAILAQMGAQVYTVERQTDLAVRARQLLESLGYLNVHVRIADGTQGWAEHAPYDAIIVTAAGPEVPPPLWQQLAPGGRLVIPLGPMSMQQLCRFEYRPGRPPVREDLGGVCFVPLLGQHGWGWAGAKGGGGL